MQLTNHLSSLGRYELVKKIADGGMAEIYLAKILGSSGFEKELVIKLILPHWSTRQDFVDMMTDEAKLTAKLNHPNIVQVFEFDEADGRHFIAMEYVPGFDLRNMISQSIQRAQKIPVSICLYLVKELLIALEFAHSFRDERGKSLNIIHRDISPQNILVSHTGVVKLTDFGIASAVERQHETQTGVLKGKYSYMSPEQAKGASIDHRVDLFAAAVVLFEILTLNRPFGLGNELQTLRNVQNVNINWDLLKNAGLPKALTKLLQKALHPNIEKRFPTAAAFLLALKDFQSASKEEFIEYLQSQNVLQQVPENQQTQSINQIEGSNQIQENLEKKSKTKVPLFFALVASLLVSSFLLIPALRSLNSEDLDSESKSLTNLKQFLLSYAEPAWHEGKKIEQEFKQKASFQIEVEPKEAKLYLSYGKHKWSAKESITLEDIPLSEDETQLRVLASLKGYKKQEEWIPISQKEPFVAHKLILEKKVEKKGSIFVSARPWGRVTISGIARNRETPYRRAGLKPSSYLVRVTGANQKVATRRVQITGGRRTICSINFDKSRHLSCR